MTLFALSCFIGVGATAIMDLWGLLRKFIFGAKAPDYRLVGRWIGHMPQGRFRHDAIARVLEGAPDEGTADAAGGAGGD